MQCSSGRQWLTWMAFFVTSARRLEFSAPRAHARVCPRMQGVDLYAVGKLLGHKAPRMTQGYAHLSPQYMAEAVGKLDSAFGEAMPEKQLAMTLRAPNLVRVESPLLERLTLGGCKSLN